jgi:hypothetical protein
MYEKMLKAMPEGHPFPPYSMAPKKLFTKDNEMVTLLYVVLLFIFCVRDIFILLGNQCIERADSL